MPTKFTQEIYDGDINVQDYLKRIIYEYTKLPFYDDELADILPENELETKFNKFSNAMGDLKKKPDKYYALFGNRFYNMSEKDDKTELKLLKEVYNILDKTSPKNAERIQTDLLTYEEQKRDFYLWRNEAVKKRYELMTKAIEKWKPVKPDSTTTMFLTLQDLQKIKAVALEELKVSKEADCRESKVIEENFEKKVADILSFNPTGLVEVMMEEIKKEIDKLSEEKKVQSNATVSEAQDLVMQR